MALTGQEGYIYLIRCEGTTYYKIGITRANAENRVKALQTGCPFNLQLVMMFRTNTPEETEAWAQTVLEGRRVNGEWFDLDPQAFCDFIVAINPIMVDYVRIPLGVSK